MSEDSLVSDGNEMLPFLAGKTGGISLSPSIASLESGYNNSMKEAHSAQQFILNYLRLHYNTDSSYLCCSW